MSFIEKLTAAQTRNHSALCLGLDIVNALAPLPILYSDEPMLPFAREMIEATQDLVCAFKLDLAYFFAEGAAGMVALERITRLIPKHIPLVLDLGCSAIGAGADAYARGAFAQFNADAALIWMQGRESIVPSFLSETNLLNKRAVIVDVPMEEPAYTAHWMRHWQTEYAAGVVNLVAKPERPDSMRILRSRSPNLPFWVRGFNPAHLNALAEYGITKGGVLPTVCVSHEIIYASRREDFAPAARAAADDFRQRLNAALV